MTTSDPARPVQNSLASDVLSAARYYLGGRTKFIMFAAAALGFGAYFNWGWLVAAGIAPILLALASCAVMCAMGMCMGGKSKSQTDDVSPGSIEGADTKLPLNLAAPGADRDETSVSSKTAQAKPGSRKDCC